MRRLTPAIYCSWCALAESPVAVSKQYLANLRRFPLRLWIRLIDVNQDIEELLRIERACFSERMSADREFFFEYSADPRAVGFLIFEEAACVGYMMGTRINDENSPEIFARYPDMEENKENIFYLQSISILEEYRSPIIFDFALHETAVLAKKLDYTSVAGHAIKKRGFSRLLQRRYGARVLHTYDDWRDYREKFDYVYFEHENLITLSDFERSIFIGLRRLRWSAQAIRNKFRTLI